MQAVLAILLLHKLIAFCIINKNKAKFAFKRVIKYENVIKKQSIKPIFN